MGIQFKKLKYFSVIELTLKTSKYLPHLISLFCRFLSIKLTIIP